MGVLTVCIHIYTLFGALVICYILKYFLVMATVTRVTAVTTAVTTAVIGLPPVMNARNCTVAGTAYIIHYSISMFSRNLAYEE